MPFLNGALTRIRWVLMLPLIGLVGCVESHFYYPDRVTYGTPAQAGLKYEEVFFASRDGTRLAGWSVPAAGVADARQARGTVIHFHGNAQNLSAHWSFVDWLPRRGFNVFVFDYRGYGKSEGKPGIKGVFEDSNAAIDHVRSRQDIDPSRLLVFGQSLGGTNAIAAVGSGNRAGIRAVAVESTFFSYSSIANDKIFGAGLLMDDRYSAERFIGQISPMPFLLIHGTRDSIIPHDHAIRLFAKAGEPRRLVSVEGGAHIEALVGSDGAVYQDLLVQFFDGALAQR